MGTWLEPSDWLNNIVTLLVVAGLSGAVVLLLRSPVWGEPLHRLGRNRGAMICLLILSLYGAVAVMDSITWRDGPRQLSMSALDHLFEKVPLEKSYSSPMARYDTDKLHPTRLKGWHLLGTDGIGNDVLLETLKGARTAWIVGGFTLLLAIPVAILLGIASGYFGGWFDDCIQYVYVTLSSIPSILLLITLMMVLGKGLWQICAALAVTQWLDLMRYLRGETLKQREKEYVLAAQAIGVHPFKILMRHILPNVFHLVIISATLSFSGLILYETVLSYLGVGVPGGVGSWGAMINAARMELAREPMVWWVLTGSSAALFVMVLSANLLGDAIRDAFDPRLREG